jgi:hypothetical protein
MSFYHTFVEECTTERLERFLRVHGQTGAVNIEAIYDAGCRLLPGAAARDEKIEIIAEFIKGEGRFADSANGPQSTYQQLLDTVEDLTRRVDGLQEQNEDLQRQVARQAPPEQISAAMRQTRRTGTAGAFNGQ